MFLKYNLPALIWAIVVLILLGLPANDFPDNTFLNIPYLDKIVHLFLFFVFVFLFAFGFAKQRKYIIMQKHFLMFAFLLGLAYGAITELMQGSVFISRTPDIYDFMFDTCGCFVGALSVIILRKQFTVAK